MDTLNDRKESQAPLMVPDKSEAHIATADEMVEATMSASKVNASTITAQKADLPAVGEIDEKRPSIEMVVSGAAAPLKPQIPKTIVLSRERNAARGNSPKV